MRELVECVGLSNKSYDELKPEVKKLYDYVFHLGVDPKEVSVVVSDLAELFAHAAESEFREWTKEELMEVFNEDSAELLLQR